MEAYIPQVDGRKQAITHCQRMRVETEQLRPGFARPRYKDVVKNTSYVPVSLLPRFAPL